MVDVAVPVHEAALHAHRVHRLRAGEDDVGIRAQESVHDLLALLRPRVNLKAWVGGDSTDISSIYCANFLDTFLGLAHGGAIRGQKVER